MTTDPPVMRADGLCARPGCTRPLIKQPPKTMPKSLRPMFMAAISVEPFCSAQCCRTVYQAIENNSPWLVNHGVPANKVTLDHTRSRMEYRSKHRVPCEGGCGKLVEGKGRGNRRGSDPNRPFMCMSCGAKWRKEQRLLAKELAA